MTDDQILALVKNQLEYRKGTIEYQEKILKLERGIEAIKSSMEERLISKDCVIKDLRETIDLLKAGRKSQEEKKSNN